MSLSRSPPEAVSSDRAMVRRGRADCRINSGVAVAAILARKRISPSTLPPKTGRGAPYATTRIRLPTEPGAS